LQKFEVTLQKLSPKKKLLGMSYCRQINEAARGNLGPRNRRGRAQHQDVLLAEERRTSEQQEMRSVQEPLQLQEEGNAASC
jgi:hypothetical protein